MTNDLHSLKPDGCEEVSGDRIADRLDERLSAAEGEAIDAHLARCPDCAARARDVESLVAALAQDDVEVTVPQAVDLRVREMAREEASRLPTARRARPPRLLRWAAAACLLAGAFGGGLLLGTSDLFTERDRGRNTTMASALFETRQQAQRLMAELTAQKTDADARITTLRRELGSEIRRSVELAKHVERSTREETRLRQRVASLATDVATQKTQVAALRKGLTDARNDATVLANRVRKRDEDLADIVKALNLERERYASLAANVVERRRKTAKLEERVLRLEAARGGRGDFNGDGRTDVVDAMAICRLLTQGRSVAYAESADLNGDGKVDVGDAVLIAGLAFSGKSQ